ncbi:sodium/hydrogen exchanger [Spirochaeta thermophila DSM 6578]|uniref:Sodium/hydrogen exchanger n=1 Tax=Winmispira thermophila (strain ATCC 700085 / DSM 6578 / Z-1203) TaxID=869211 RepID=G0GDZ6_WINT7|nr:cation:proton antiporter [Spirochaeta thermophila]AEJ60628.1 sodium/hydrogen exchanger [Spirochaeta thermophila DSM 6578]
MEVFHDLVSRISVEQLNVLLLLGVVLFGGTIGAVYFKKARIPQVIAYILLGILVGKSGLRLFSEDFLSSFEPFNYLALGLISFALGGELDLSLLKKHGKVLTWVLFLEVFGAFIMVGTGFFLLGRLFFDPTTSLVIALLAGSISSATAAAGTTDVVWEYRAKGVLTTTLLGIIALDDVLALLLFAITSSISFALMGVSANLVVTIGRPFYEIGGATLLGWVAAWLLSRQLAQYTEEERIFVFTTGMVVLVLGLSLALDLDMLMAATVMGFALRQYAPRKTEVILRLLEKFAGPIYLLFFVFVGASLEVASISLSALVFIAAFLLFRIGGKTVGTRMGAWISGAPEKVGRYLPLCLLSQSGVAIGLSLIAYQRFPGTIGQTILVVVTTTVFVVQLVGPALVKVALEKAGEAGLNVTEEDILTRHRVADVLPADRAVVPNTIRLSELLRLYAEHDWNVWAVVDAEDRYRGVVGFENLREALAEPELQEFVIAEDILTPFPETVHPHTPLHEALRIMRRRNVDFLPVLDDRGHVLGILEERMVRHFVRRELLSAQARTGL